MESGAVIKGFDVNEELEPGLGPGGRSVFKAFDFQSGEKRFRQRVVVRVAGAAHAGRDFETGQ